MALAVAACRDPAPPAAPVPSPTACTNHLVATAPPDGATDVYYRNPVRFTLAEPDPLAVIRVYDEDGAQLAGPVRVDGTEVSWEGVLVWGGGHTAELSFACGTARITFWTQGELPWPPEDPQEGSYRWNLQAGDSSSSLITTVLEDLRTSALALDGGGIVWRAASDDWCSPSAELAGTFDGTTFEAQAEALVLDGIVVWHPAVSGAFSLQRDRIVDGALRGAVAADTIAERLGIPVETLCETLPCEPCPQKPVGASPAPTCVPAAIDDIPVLHEPWDDVQERTPQQIAADPNCAAP